MKRFPVFLTSMFVVAILLAMSAASGAQDDMEASNKATAQLITEAYWDSDLTNAEFRELARVAYQESPLTYYRPFSYDIGDFSWREPGDMREFFSQYITESSFNTDLVIAENDAVVVIGTVTCALSRNMKLSPGGETTLHFLPASDEPMTWQISFTYQFNEDGQIIEIHEFWRNVRVESAEF